MPENLSRSGRPVAKERIELFTDIVNRSATEAVSLYEFYWLVTHRLTLSTLPDRYKQFGSERSFVAHLWQRYGREGYCLDAYGMRIIEQRINEPDSV